MTPVSGFTYPALALVATAWFLWHPNPSIIEIAFCGAFLCSLIIFFWVIYLSEMLVADSKVWRVWLYYASIALGWHLRLWLQQDRPEYAFSVWLLGIWCVGMIGIAVQTTKTEIGAVRSTLMYEAPPPPF